MPTSPNRTAGAIATYQPINSQEREAVQRIALGQLEMRRMSIAVAGFFTNCFDKCMEAPGKPFILDNAEVTQGIDVKPGRTAPTGSPSASISTPGKARRQKGSCECRRRPSACIAAPWRISTAFSNFVASSRPKNTKKTNPFPSRNLLKTHPSPNPAPAENPENEPNADPSPAPAAAADPERKAPNSARPAALKSKPQPRFGSAPPQRTRTG